MSVRTRASSPSGVTPTLPRFIRSENYIETAGHNNVVGTVYLMPLTISQTCIVDQIIYFVAATALGNVRLGIYREGTPPDLPDGGALVVESASVAQPGTNRFHFVPIANTVLIAGRYWIAIQGDAVGTFRGVFDAASSILRSFALVYGAFTNPCPATAAGTNCPAFMLRKV